MRGTVNRIWSSVGFRGSALLFFAVLDFVIGFSYLYPPPEQRQTASLRYLADLAPLPAWGAVWGAVGVVCLVFAFRRHDKVAFAAAIGIKILWGGIYVGGALVAHLERAYVSAGLWLCIAGFVAIISAWPEPDRIAKGSD